MSTEQLVPRLRSMQARVAPDVKVNDDILTNIVNVSNHCLLFQPQPKKAERIFDLMLGQHLAKHVPIDNQLLIKTMYQYYGIEV